MYNTYETSIICWYKVKKYIYQSELMVQKSIKKKSGKNDGEKM